MSVYLQRNRTGVIGNIYGPIALRYGDMARRLKAVVEGGGDEFVHVHLFKHVYVFD